MRFELTVALKYLIPRWQQLSVSIISLISVLVISLVVWLVLIFLSVTEGIEKKWIDELVALNAPVRMIPTEAYYQSYYYQIDSIAQDSNYTLKTIGEKRLTPQTDPYNPQFDRELLSHFPAPDCHEDGRLKDLVKEGCEALSSLPFEGLRFQEYEMTFGNLRLQVTPKEAREQTFLTQVSYIASHDGENKRVNQMLLPLAGEDYNHLLEVLAQTSPSVDQSDIPLTSLARNWAPFFKGLEINELKTNLGFVLPSALFPQEGHLKGIGLVKGDQIVKVMLPATLEQLPLLNAKLLSFGYHTTPIELLFNQQQVRFTFDESFKPSSEMPLVLDENIALKANLIESSLTEASALTAIAFEVEGRVQQLPIRGKIPFDHVAISKAVPNPLTAETLWVTGPSVHGGGFIPCSQRLPFIENLLGEGLLVSKQFKNSGVRLGDRGHLSYYAQTGSGMQEQKIPVYVAGFYDPGVMPIGNKLIFVDPSITALLRSSSPVADPLLGNGINIWIDRLSDAPHLKEKLIERLEAMGIKKYWDVQSYRDYEFTRPILEQLQSDKNLFTLIALIILVVACSNIISMLILLVNDKKKEIGILQSMGASSKSIASIFGFCGFIMGLTSCVIGIGSALLTLKNLQSLIDLLSFFQGRDAFQAAFYGTTLPNDLSYSALLFVVIATLFISLLAGIIPAVKASRIRPTEILRLES